MRSSPHIVPISRALAKHEPSVVYTLLREFIPQGLAGRILHELIQTQHNWPKPEHKDDVEYNQILSRMEMRVLRDSDKGMSTEEIAHSVPMSPLTVNSHKKHIYRKLGAHSIAEAIKIGRERGLLY